ncbi:protein of unknown function DUF885 [Beutenbergia cavernae DSM 12333]|uniref:DUF885 domain-containing protein n=1 Tax=Beutenbergia cavernae (strain ATCC BAA-8 / DSM 12333 / CCUG 43141 / JCM 11478 / NBRC 16432 / NCIMB 13614 / HKI 0122) TaxID=471853 RepID=C5C100_BEUC1|nr:DUF885 domain-containing protein [Beutenbergia cavernae]ACQ79404.1 protein of unknown function DUF885 [Beutenbergia cavernae DSM 12333]
MTTAERASTPTDAVAEDYVTTLGRLSPMLRTYVGLPGDQSELDDFSPAGLATQDAERTAVLGRLAGIAAIDEVDTVTQAAMRERLGLEGELYDAGEDLSNLNVISSPLQGIREIFDLMPTDTAEDWATIAARMANVPAAIDGFTESLREGAATGLVAATRQVAACIAQAEELAGDDSFWAQLAERGAQAGDAAALVAGADAARGAYGELATFLRDELAPRAPEADAVGRERYERFSRTFLGAQVDLDETYEWGLEELARIVAEQDAVAAELYGSGTSPEEAMARLDADPARQLHGTDALREWMQTTSDAAVAALADTQFDIPEPVRRLECMIAPTQSGGIYYTGPTNDFSRPGRMWWAVPEGVTEFGTWRERTTVYHEGVPGHHLQIGQTVYRSALLNTWRRQLCWVSGHGEGWALYAERLMADLGFLDDPADRMGMLDGQRLRAARVVLDIGVHLGKPCPSAWGGGTWDAEKAWTFLDANANMAEGFLRFELDRYLGWPGQAPAYKVGQRLWEQIRDDARAVAGDAFDLRAFHRRALDVGSVGLDVLREALSQPTAASPA